jgi:hypothetical protein
VALLRWIVTLALALVLLLLPIVITTTAVLVGRRTTVMKVGVIIEGKVDRKRGMRDGREVEEAGDMEVSGLNCQE